MKITLKLFASLAVHLPPEARARHQVDLEVAPGATVQDLIQRQGIPPTQCAIVLVDGAWVALPERSTRVLTEGEVLAIWPPVAGGQMTSFVSLEMTISREEFLRLLPVAVGQACVQEAEGRFSGGEGLRRWSLHLRPLAPRRLGSVVLPCHQVELRFEGHAEAEVAEFMARFHRGFQRGGG